MNKKKKIKKWGAYIKINRKQIHLGTFKNFRDAVKARWEGEKNNKFPNCCTTSSAYKYLNDNKKC